MKEKFEINGERNKTTEKGDLQPRPSLEICSHLNENETGSIKKKRAHYLETHFRINIGSETTMRP